MPDVTGDTMTTVATALVELLAEAGVQYVFGVPSGPWVPAIAAYTVEDVHDAVAQGLASDGPLVVEAVVNPSEYDELILRPHK